MKKILFTSLSLILTLITVAQIPSGFSAAYLFNNSSLANKGASSSQNLSNLTALGSFSDISNRKGTDKQAISIIPGVRLNATQTNTVNYRPLTVSYWVKIAAQDSGSTRLLQFYGNYSGQGNTGFEMNAIFSKTGTQLTWKAGMYAGGSYRGYSNSTAVDTLDDGKWHHIVFRATPIGNNLNINVFVDNVLATGLTGNVTTPRGLGDFIRRSTFMVAPLRDYTGGMDDIRIYYSSLSDSLVGDLYNEVPVLPKIIYVNHTAAVGGDGSSWAKAYVNLRDGLINADEGDQVWIAKGKYIRSIANRGASFAWTVNALSVYGGFSGDGTETSLSQRDWLKNETILSGDLGKDGDISNNAYCVLTGPYAQTAADAISSAYVDGLIVQDGNANESTTARFGRFGAGTLIESFVSKVEFVNCTWRNNQGINGAGVAIYAEFSEKDISFTNCRFSENKARAGAPFDALTYGKDIYLKMYNCLIDNNEVIDIGGGNGNYGHGGRVISYNNGFMEAVFLNTTWANNIDTSSSTDKILFSTHRRFGSGQSVSIFENCIMSDNGAMSGNFNYPRISSNGAANQIDVRNCLIDDTTAFYTRVVLNNPMISKADFVDVSKDDFQLKNTSMAVDARPGSNSRLPTIDLAGNPRVYNDSLDLGCFENQGNNGNNNGGGGEEPGDSTLSNVNSVTAQSYSVYPNPASDILNITSNNALVFDLTILSLSGQVLVEKQHTNQVQVADLPAGIYILQINDSNKLEYVRFIKE